MSVESVIYDRLAADATLAALVGNRIYPIRAPQEAVLPLVVYQRIGGATVNGSTAVSGTSNPQFQIDCISGTYGDAKRVADAVRSSLNKWFSSGTTPELNLALQDERDDYTPPIDQSEEGVFRVMQDYSIWHN